MRQCPDCGKTVDALYPTRIYLKQEIPGDGFKIRYDGTRYLCRECHDKEIEKRP